MKKRGSKQGLIQGLSTVLAGRTEFRSRISVSAEKMRACVVITYWDGTSETLDITDNDCGQIGLKIFEEVYG